MSAQLKAMFLMLLLSVPVHGVKERGGEVIFVLLCFLLILRLLQPADGGSFGCYSMPLKLWERTMLPFGHSPLFLPLSTHVCLQQTP